MSTTDIAGWYSYTHRALVYLSRRQWKAIWKNPAATVRDCVRRHLFTDLHRKPSFSHSYGPWSTQMDPPLSRIYGPIRSMASPEIGVILWRCAPLWIKNQAAEKLLTLAPNSEDKSSLKDEISIMAIVTQTSENTSTNNCNVASSQSFQPPILTEFLHAQASDAYYRMKHAQIGRNNSEFSVNNNGQQRPSRPTLSCRWSITEFRFRIIIAS